MASDYVVQIVQKSTGKVVAGWAPGRGDEADLVSQISGRIVEKGIGFWRTEAHVMACVHDALDEWLHDLKKQV